jgi:hypothetical protein
MKDKRTIQELFEPRLQSGLFGVEIEMESDGPIDARLTDIPEWLRLADGSLRGEFNAEYVLVKPLRLKSAKAAITKLKAALQNAGTEINDSVRAGVHIHLNVQDLTMQELLTLLTAYYILEDALVDKCGEGRAGNHFCLRARDSDWTMFLLSNALREDRLLQQLGAFDRIRYSAMNLAAIMKFGSIEFRAIRTPTDLEEIFFWLDVFDQLKKNYHLYQNPIQMVENISLGGEMAFLDNILGPQANAFKDDPNLANKLLGGVRLAQEIAYTGSD